MRKTIVAFVVALALLAVSVPAQAAPEVQRLYFNWNYSTGDQGVASCPDARGAYSSPMYSMDVYRTLNDGATGTAGWWGYDLYKCTRSVYQNGYKTDEYLTIYGDCAYPVSEYICSQYYYDEYGSQYCIDGYYGTTYQYGSMVGWQGRSLAAGWDANAVSLYLATRTASDQGGLTWSELVVLPESWLGSYGASAILWLGYVKGDSGNYYDREGTLTSAYDQCVEGSGCFGECGPNCDGILGTHYSTSSCLEHDRCVCRNGGNMYAWDCLGDFIAAAVSLVAAIVVDLIKTVVGWIISGIKSIFRALCFWC